MKKLSKTSQPRSGRTAFTLVELLLVIAIIAILASLGVGVMAQAQQDAAVAATRSRMNVIEKILEIELEDYEVLRSPVPFGGISSMVLSSMMTDATNGAVPPRPGPSFLLHVKNLKRMILADLIRAEMPDGSVTGNDGVSLFPSDALLDYLDDEFGISRAEALPWFPTDYTTGNENNFNSLLPSVSGWSSFSVPSDSQVGDGIDEGAANKSELLYQMLLNIDADGIPAVDQLGSAAIGDTDSDGIPEIIDGWGEPLYLQWQQESLIQTGAFVDNVWGPTAPPTFIGLSKEHPLLGFPINSYAKPVLPIQIRPFLISERMLNIDGLPTDYDMNHAF